MTATTHPHIIPLVRKLRDSGVSQSAAEAIGEAMEQVPTKADLRDELTAMESRINTKMEAMESRLAARIDAGNQRMMLATAAFIAVGVTVLMF